MGFAELAQLSALIAFGVGVLAIPGVLALSYYWRFRRAETRIVELEDEVQQLHGELQELEQQQGDTQRTGMQPLHTPPAGIMPLFRATIVNWPEDTLCFPIGWVRVQGQPSGIYATFDPASDQFAGNILLTGKTRFGKDTLLFLIFWTLCRRNRPEHLQIVYIDGKRADGALWQGLAHNLIEPAIGQEDIPVTLRTLRSLRQARERQRAAIGVTQWSETPLAQRPPLVVVFISELDLLELAVPDGEKLEDWLSAELATSLASGICYIIGTQTVANRKTRWRDQCLTYIAGFQDTSRAVEPNLGMSEREITELGGVSPIQFRGKVYFTARMNRAVVTVRTPYLSLEDRRAAIDQLPRRSEAIVAPAAQQQRDAELARLLAALPDGVLNDLGQTNEQSAPIEDQLSRLLQSLTPEDRRKIINLRQQLPSRSAVFQAFWGTERKPGGPHYQVIRTVLDEAGMP